jgi:hypothetical protein
VFDADGKPAYPPRQDTWQFPPPPLQKRWKWLAVLATVLGVLAGSAMLTAVIVLADDDYPGLIDDERLTATVATQCGLMTATVESIPPGGTPERRAATIADQNRAIQRMVESIRARRTAEIRDDRPAEQWLQDWDRLVEARRQFARALQRDPNASLEVPVDDDGVEITQRMNDVWADDTACEVPEVLVTSDAESRSDV